MNLEELKARVDFMHKQSRNPKEDIVYITTSEHSLGGRAKCGVKSVSLGFDWENHQVRIEPELKLIKEQTNEKWRWNKR